MNDLEKTIAKLQERVRQLELAAQVTTHESFTRPVKRACGTHGTRHWIESVPAGAGYCQQCAKDQYDSASRCPHCGTKRGFAFGTGDCGCY